MSMREFEICTYVKLNDKYLFERKNSNNVQKALSIFMIHTTFRVYFDWQPSFVCLPKSNIFCESRMKKEIDKSMLIDSELFFKYLVIIIEFHVVFHFKIEVSLYLITNFGLFEKIIDISGQIIITPFCCLLSKSRDMSN